MTTLAKRPEAVVPLAQAAQALSEITRQIDEGADLNATILAQFSNARLDLATGVDFTVGMLRFLEGNVQACKAARDAYIARANQLEQMAKAWKEATIGVMQKNPDLPYAGTLGRLAIQKNPPSLKLTFETQSCSTTITDETLLAVGISPKYVQPVYKLLTDVVKADLKAGIQIPWASTDQGNHLRIRE